MTVTGDWDKLEKALAELTKLGNPALVSAAGKNVAQTLVAQVQLGFRKEQSPAGDKWAPLKRDRAANKKASKRNGKSSKGKILYSTGGLTGSINGQANGETVTVGSNKSYAPYHQFGTKGHKQDSSRQQPVKGAGYSPFISKAKAAKAKGSVAFRTLNFKAGNGKIPARPFLPLEGLPSSWRDAVARTLGKVVSQAAPSLVASAG